MAVLILSGPILTLTVMQGLLAMSRMRMGFFCAGSISLLVDCATAAAEQAVAIAIAARDLMNFGIGHIFRSEGQPRAWRAIWPIVRNACSVPDELCNRSHFFLNGPQVRS